MQLQLSLGCQPQHGFDAANFRRALPYVDQWMNWRYGFFDHEFLPVTEEAKRRGASVQHYSCGTSMREPIYFTYRLMPWFGELHGLAVDGLCDGADGTPRNVVFRGFSTHTLGKNLTFTGRIRIEDGAFLNVNSTSGLGPIPAEARTNQIVIAGQNCGFNPRCKSMNFSEKIGITVEPGTAVTFYPSGSVTEDQINTFKGPLCGSGTITMGDNGGFAFTATNNSFSGNISLGTHNRQQWFKIGNGANFSWAGSKITQLNYTNNLIVINCDADVVFNTVPARILDQNCIDRMKKCFGTSVKIDAFAADFAGNSPYGDIIRDFEAGVEFAI